MKINFEDYLHKLDLFFKDKTPKDKYMIFIMAAAGIFAFSYLFFWDSSFASFKQTRKNVVSLQEKINKDKMFLQINPKQKVMKYDREIQNINQELATLKDKNAYIKTKIETISSLIYDEQAWGQYLNSIAQNAKAYNVKVLELTNKFSDLNSHFGHLLDITITSSGKFKNTLKFINSLEQSELVVDIHDFNIEICQ